MGRIWKVVMLVGCLLWVRALIGMAWGEEKGEAYLFTSFREPSTEGLEYIYSYDGLTWDSVPGRIMSPAIDGEKRVLRDPSICQGPDGTYHLVWTTQWKGNRCFGYSSSKDLVHWTEKREIGVMDTIPTNNVWAPEVFYDEDYGKFFVIWASQIPREEYTQADSLGINLANRLYYTTTTDFVTFTPTERYYDPGFNSIDGFLVKRGKGDYVLIVKDNRKPGFSNLFCVFGESPYGPFGNPSERFGRTYSEGPCAIPLNGEWVIYFDQYKPQEYGAVVTSDFRTLRDIKDLIKVPAKHKHGTIIKVKREDVERLLDVAGKSQELAR